jgi:hypothetical protein
MRKILILTILLGGCHKAAIYQTQMEHMYGRYEYRHEGELVDTRGTRDIKNSLVYYYTLWNQWPTHPTQLYNMINQQQTKTMDSLIVSLSEFKTVDINSTSDTVSVDYNFKSLPDEIKTFRITKSNDSIYNVIDGNNAGLIYLRKKHYR